MQTLTQAPQVGQLVAAVLNDGRRQEPRVSKPARVLRVRDHKPVDGTAEANALVDMDNGETHFWWNLTAVNLTN